MPIITALEVQKKNKERVNVSLDGEYAFSLTLIEAAALRKGQSLNEQEIAALKSADELQRAVDHAARYLSYRPRSIEEIRRHLTQKSYPEHVIEAAIERLDRLGYLDDMAFAKFWLQDRTTFKPRGPVAIRYELRQKGIADSIIDTVLESLDVQEAAFRAAQDRARRMRGSSRQEVRSKIGSFLQRRGFHYSTSRDVINRLFSILDAEDPGYFVDEDDDPVDSDFP